MKRRPFILTTFMGGLTYLANLWSCSISPDKSVSTNDSNLLEENVPVALPKKKWVWFFSDIHVGREANDHDGGFWLEKAVADVNQHFAGEIDHCCVLGDLTENADLQSIKQFMKIKKRDKIPQTFYIAGNHDNYNKDALKNFKKYTKSELFYTVEDGNILYIFFSYTKGD